MKKMIALLKITCVAGLLTVIGPLGASAQGLRTSYFMDNVSARLKMNPALQPARGYFNIPVIGAFGLSANSNALSIDDFVDIIENENDFLNSDKFINRLKDKNTMNIDFTTDIISFGFYSGKSFWTVNAGIRSIISTSIPKRMFEFAQKSGEFTIGDKYDIKNMELHADIFTEIGLGYSRTIMENLTIGGRLKFLVGVGNLDAKIDKIYVNTQDGYDTWRVETKGRLEASVKGLELGYNTEGNKEYIDDIDFDTPGVSGYGVGFDFGANYNLFNRINISAAILDVGFIKWSKSSTVIATTDGKHSYGDVISTDPSDYENHKDGSDVFDLDLIQFEKQEAKERKTTLRSTLNIGAEYTILNNKLGFGILSSTQFLLPTSYSELTVSANYRPKNWFGATVSYSFLHSEVQTVGIGLKFGPIFIGSDYIMTEAPGKSKRANTYLGVSIPLGKKRLDYQK